ncbi:hypothetical protein BDN72DRAFT_958065 [Pluteus cervinus]|uniref:Uncharacterized protein n=1 Tax=Pluteus cervinus TaxID=181527 RepID=A0ACD3B1Q1_9AGAR|nr:hypothetical protein BDN72DRAFT_958065 [Pluteus cervinus]
MAHFNNSRVSMPHSNIYNTINHNHMYNPLERQSRRGVPGSGEESGREATKTRKEMLDDVLQKLPSINYLQSHEEASRKVIGEGGKWFLQHEKFKNWMNGRLTAFLGLGDPGVGKTCLVSLVISHIQELKGATRGAYLYVSHQKAEVQTPTNIVSTLLRQLLSTHSSLPDSAVGLYEQLNLDQGPQLKVLVTTLISMCTDPGFRTYIVLDALDECKPSHQPELIQILEQLLTAQVQLFATSRPVSEDFSSLFDSASCTKYFIRATTSDISDFLKQKLKSKKALGSFVDEKFKEEVIKTIRSKSEGIFLIAAMQVDHIISLTNKAEMKEALLNFPADLETNFSMTLTRIKAQSPKQSNLAFKVMELLVTVIEPLTTNGLCYALGTELKSERFNSDKLTSCSMIVECCCGLVTIQGDEESSDADIDFFHLSVLEYMEKQFEANIPSFEKQLALTCLTYLTIDNLCKDGMIISWLDAVTSGDAASFYKYAAKYWGIHAAKNIDHDIMELIKLLISKRGHVTKWGQVDYAEKYENTQVQMLYDSKKHHGQVKQL